MPVTRQEPHFGFRPPDRREERAPDQAHLPNLDSPARSTHWARSDDERPARPSERARGGGTLWLLITGLAISASALYLVYAMIVSPAPSPALGPSGRAPSAPDSAQASAAAPAPLPTVSIAPAPPPHAPSGEIARPIAPPAADGSPRQTVRPVRLRGDTPPAQRATQPRLAPDPTPPSYGDGPPVDARDLPPLASPPHDLVIPPPRS